MYQYETKNELRDTLRGHKIINVEFGSGSKGDLSDERSLSLHLDNGESVVIDATTYGALTFTS